MLKRKRLLKSRKRRENMQGKEARWMEAVEVKAVRRKLQ